MNKETKKTKLESAKTADNSVKTKSKGAAIVGSGSAKSSKLKTTVGNLIAKLRSDRKWQQVIIGVLIVMIGVAVGAGLYLRARHNKQLELERRSRISQVTTSTEADSKLLKGNYKGVQDTINNSANPQSQANLLLSALAYEGQNNYNQALHQFKLSEKLYGLDSNLAINIGYAESQLHDNQAAVIYYKKAIALLNTAGDPAAKKAIPSLQQRIDAL